MRRSCYVLYREKKGQIKMLESVAVLIVFFFLVALGLKFYGNIQVQKLEQSLEQFNRLDSIKITNIVMSMPELTCTSYNVRDGSCVDRFKALAWQELGQSLVGDYLNQFGDSTIEVYEIYPESRIDGDVIMVYNNTPKQWDQLTPTRVPIVIYDPEERAYNLGILQITIYT